MATACDSCSTGCQSSCYGTCAGSCVGSCSYTCLSSASSNSCSGCTDSCYTTCSTACFGTCSGSATGSSTCQSCMSSCTGNCKDTCSNGCYNTCVGQSMSTALASCVQSCAGACYSCSGSCMQTCSNACVGSCEGSCHESCSNGCKSGCTGCTGCTGCSSECSNSCTSTCANSCGNTCSGSCSGCTGCSGSCLGGCIGTCEKSCSGGCSESCENTCMGSCLAECDGTCKGDCLGCTSTCATNCAGNCRGDCTASCVGTCQGSNSIRTPITYTGTAETAVHYRKVNELVKIQQKVDLNDDDQIIAVQSDSAKRVDVGTLMTRITDRITVPPQYILQATLASSTINGVKKHNNRTMEATSVDIGRLTFGLLVSVSLKVEYTEFHDESSPWKLKLNFNDATSSTDIIYLSNGLPATDRIEAKTQVLTLVYFDNVNTPNGVVSGWFIPNIAHIHDDRYYTQTEIDEAFADVDATLATINIITDPETNDILRNYNTYAGVSVSACKGTAKINIPTLNIPSYSETVGIEDTRTS